MQCKKHPTYKAIKTPSCDCLDCWHQYYAEHPDVIPNPGSDEAIRLGCSCAILDNSHGLGFPWNGEISFWISADCPVHGGHTLTEEEERQNGFY